MVCFSTQSVPLNSTWCCSQPGYWRLCPSNNGVDLERLGREPAETHVQGFGDFRDNDVGGDANGGEVVGIESIFWLRPFHFDGILANQDNDFGRDKERGELRLCGGGHTKLNDLSKSKNSMGESRDLVIFTKEDV